MTPARRNILLAAAALAALSAGMGAGAALSAPDTHKTGPHRVTTQRTTSEAPVPAADLASPKYGNWGFDISGMDTSVKPGDDFFNYANGKWAARTEIPSDRVRFGNFDKLSVLSENRVHAIDMDAAAGKLTDKDGAKIGAAYASFMNEALADKLGAKPIAPELAQIRAVKTKDDFTALMGKGNHTGFTTILPVGITIDAKAPTKYAVLAATGGLGLPDRDYYLQPAFAEKKAKYLAYVQQILTLAGWPKPAENAKAIVDFETQLAE
ncbi:MAG: peptidase M13, partial [Phenylobacterium sp.]